MIIQVQVIKTLSYNLGGIMTRGRLVFINSEGIFVSTEFNGGMNIENFGKVALAMMEKIKDEKEFFETVRVFARSISIYELEELMEDEIFSSLIEAPMDSEYLYIKNTTDNPISFEKETIEPNSISTFCYSQKVDKKTIDSAINQFRDFPELHMRGMSLVS